MEERLLIEGSIYYNVFTKGMMIMKLHLNETREWVLTILVTIVLIFVIRTYIFSPVIVEGDSMNPTLIEGDRLFINKIGMYIGDIDRLDIVVFKGKNNTHYIKRVVGMPGDRLQFKNNHLYINGELVSENYVIEDGFQRDMTLDTLYGYEKIPENYYFVLGDNRPNSMDSRQRSIGLVHESKILGASNVIVWPLNRIQHVKQ